MQRFLVTGVSGFLGSLLAERLLEGGYQVIGLDKKENGFLGNRALKNKNFRFCLEDLSGDGFDGKNADFEFDGIFHLAAQQPSSAALGYPDFYNGNVRTTQNVIGLARAKAAKFIIFTSTCSIFMPQPGEKYISESSVSLPRNYYTLTKFIAERLLEIELADRDTKAAVVRFPSLFGKGHLGGLVYTYYRLIKDGRDVEVYNKGERYRNLLYAHDAADVLLKALDNMDRLKKFELFICGSGDSLKTGEVAGILKDLTGSHSKIVPSGKTNFNDRDLFLDLTKAKNDLKFRPAKIREGLKAYVEEMHEKV